MRRRLGTIVAGARRWWPVPALLGSSLVIQKVFFESRYDVAGHAAGHLGSATAPFFATAIVIILLWATPPARRQVDVLLTSAAWVAATVLILIGNVRVVDALIGAGLGQLEDGAAGIPDVGDHGLANLAMGLAVVAALALTAAMWRRQHVSPRVAVAAAILNVVFPPWIVPGAGVIVLTIARCITQGRSWSKTEGRVTSNRQAAI
jgi:predicted branched-subunit amino acid permease